MSGITIWINTSVLNQGIDYEFDERGDLRMHHPLTWSDQIVILAPARWLIGRPHTPDDYRSYHGDLDDKLLISCDRAWLNV